jgi:hypothetical protein
MTIPALPTQPTPRQIATTVNAMLTGSTNATGSFTLTPSSTTTVVSDPRAGATSVILLCPMTATAAIVPIWVSHRGDGNFIVTHDSMAALDRTFTYEIRNGG